MSTGAAYESFPRNDGTAGQRVRRWMEIVRTRSGYYIPVLSWLRQYERGSLAGDVASAVSVASLLVPQSLSYSAGLARLPPQFGLYAAFFPVVVYALLGTSRHLAVGPEALVSLLIGSCLASLSSYQNYPDSSNMALLEYQPERVAATLACLVGLMTGILGVMRLGFFDSILSKALLRGFIYAVALVIVIEQLPALLGISIDHHSVVNATAEPSPIAKLMQVLRNLHLTNPTAALLSFCSVSFLFSFALFKIFYAKWTAREQNRVDNNRDYPMPDLEDNDQEQNDRQPLLRPRSHRLFVSFRKLLPVLKCLTFLPEVLIVVVITILVTHYLNLSADPYNIKILGEAALHTGFDLPHLPIMSMDLLRKLFPTALLISIIGFVESIVATKYFATLLQYPVSANRELVALGAANVIGAFFNAFPTFASLPRSYLNYSSGAKTQMAGLLTAFLILLTTLFLLPLFYSLPHCVMASIIFVTAVNLLTHDTHEMFFLWQVGAWKDLFWMAVAFIITVGFSVEGGVISVVGISLVMVVQHSTQIKLAVLGRVMEHDMAESEDGVPKIKFRPLEEIFKNRREHVLRASKIDRQVLVVKIEEALFFGNVGQLKDRLKRAEKFGGWIHVHPSEDPMALLQSGSLPRQPTSDLAHQEPPLPSKPKKKHSIPFRPSDPYHSDSAMSDEEFVSPLPSFQRIQYRNTNAAAASEPSLCQSPHRRPLRRHSIALPSHVTSFSEDDSDNDSIDSYHTATSLLGSAPTTRFFQLRAIIFDISAMPTIDASAMMVLLHDILVPFQKRNIVISFVKVRPSVWDMFQKSGVVASVGEEMFFRKIVDAVQTVEELIQEDEEDV